MIDREYFWQCRLLSYLDELTRLGRIPVYASLVDDETALPEEIKQAIKDFRSSLDSLIRITGDHASMLKTADKNVSKKLFERG